MENLVKVRFYKESEVCYDSHIIFLKGGVSNNGTNQKYQ